MNARVLKIVVVDDYTLFRRGLIGLLSEIPEFKVVGEAEDGWGALRVIKEKRPDIVLMDVNMPHMDGISAVRAIRRLDAPPRILMLTISKNDEDLFGAIKAGADGYLLKNTEPEDLRKALLQVSRGAGILSPEVTPSILKTLTSFSPPDPPSLMSEREIDVLKCLANGMTTQEIGRALFITENTVKTHIRHILDKLEAANRTEAVSKALQMGIIQRNP